MFIDPIAIFNFLNQIDFTQSLELSANIGISNPHQGKVPFFSCFKNLIIEARKEGNLPLVGVADSNIRRQLKRLREIYLVEKIKNRYRINEHDSLSNIFSERIEQYLLQNVLSRIRDYLGKIDERF